MRLKQDEPIEVKTPGQLAVMREAGLVTAAALRAAAAAVEPGISTAELDAIAEREIRSAGAVPSFKGYYGYPATICASVNEQVVHGIPSAAQVLVAGDIISIDCGAIVRGWHGDSAITVAVGNGGRPATAALAGLLRACEQSLWRGLAAALPGGRLTDISHAVEQAARSAGQYGIVREYTGHGIGTAMHMDPAVRPAANCGRSWPRARCWPKGWRWPSGRCWCWGAPRPGCWTMRVDSGDPGRQPCRPFPSTRSR